MLYNHVNIFSTYNYKTIVYFRNSFIASVGVNFEIVLAGMLNSNSLILGPVDERKFYFTKSKTSIFVQVSISVSLKVYQKVVHV